MPGAVAFGLDRGMDLILVGGCRRLVTLTSGESLGRGMQLASEDRGSRPAILGHFSDLVPGFQYGGEAGQWLLINLRVQGLLTRPEAKRVDVDKAATQLEFAYIYTRKLRTTSSISSNIKKPEMVYGSLFRPHLYRK